MAKESSFVVSADVTPFQAAMAAAAQSASESVANIKAQFESLNATFTGLGGVFTAVTAILAGGGIAEGLSRIAERAENISKAAAIFDITGTALQGLQVIAAKSGVSSDTLISSMTRLEQRMRQAGETGGSAAARFNALGISTQELRDPAFTVIDAMEKLGASTNSTAALLGGLGRNGQVLIPIMRDLAQNHKAVAEAAASVGALTQTENDVLTRYHGQVQVTSIAVGNFASRLAGEVMPALGSALNSFTQWLESMQPSIIEGFRASLDGLGTILRLVGDVVGELFNEIKLAFGTGASIIEEFTGSTITGLELWENVIREIEVVVIAFRVVFQEVLQTIALSIDWVVDELKIFAGVAEAAFSLKWSNVKAAWATGTAQMKADLDAHLAAMKQSAVQGAADIQNALTKSFASKPSAPDKAPAPDTKDTPDISNKMAQFEAELAMKKSMWEEEKSAGGDFHEFSKEQELAFWEEKLAIIGSKGTEGLALEKKVADLQTAIRKQDFNNELADLKERETAAGKHYDQKLALAQEYATKVGTAYGTDSAKYKEAQGEIAKIDQEMVAEKRKTQDEIAKTQAQLAEIDISDEEKAAQQRVALGLESKAQLLEQERTFAAQRLAIKVKEIDDEIAAETRAGGDASKLQALNDQKLTLERQYQSQLTQIDQQAQLQRDQLWTQAASAMQSTFESSITKMLEGTQKLSVAIKQLAAGLVNELISAIVKTATRWVVEEIQKRITSTATTTAVATQQAGLTASLTTQLGLQTAAQATAQRAIIAGWAAVAGAAGTASFAGAPWPVDIGAPAFGAGMAAAAGAYVIAEKGYDVPPGANPMTQLHAKEMVLPASLAEVVRSGGGTGGGDTFHAHISAMDSKSFENYVSTPAGRKALMGAVKGAYKRGVRGFR